MVLKQQHAVPVLKILSGTGANMHLTRLGKTCQLSASCMQSHQAGRAGFAQGLPKNRQSLLQLDPCQYLS